MIVGRLKRCLAGALAVATVISSSNIAYAAESLTAGSSWSTTAAEIVAGEYYEEGSAEAEILKNDLIAQGTLFDNIVVPSDDDLVSIDTDEKVVKADVFSQNGYTWVPVSAVIDPTEDEVEEETVTFQETAGEDYGIATYGENILSCTATVTYALNVEINEADRAALANVPGTLVAGLEYYDVLEEAVTFLTQLNTKLDEYNATLGTDYSVGEELCELFDANETTEFAFLIKNYESFGPMATEALSDLERIDESLLGSFEAVYDTLVADLKRLETEVNLAPVFAGNNYGEGDLEILAGEVENTTAIEISDTITAAITTVVATADVVTVTVKVNANVASDKIFEKLSDVESKALSEYTEVFYISNVSEEYTLDTAKEDILVKASKSAKNAVASEGWESYFAEEGWYTVVTDEDEIKDLEALSDEIVYEVTYTANNLEVETDYDGKVEVPYGTKIVLPISEDDKFEYDYVVVGKESGTTTYYNEGRVLNVKEALNITRSTGSEKQTESLLAIAAKDEAYSDALEAAAGVVSSKAIDNPSVTIRYPGDAVVSDVKTNEPGSYWATAATEVETGVAGMVWKPSSARLVDNDGEITDVTINCEERQTAVEGVVENYYTWTTDKDFTRFEVEYKLEVTHVDVNAQLVEVTNEMLLKNFKVLKEIVDEVNEQNDVLQDDIKGVYDYIVDAGLGDVLKKGTLTALQTFLSGDGKKAVQEIVDKGLTKEGELKLYADLKVLAGTNWSLSTYYKEGYYQEILDQALFLQPLLETIANDSGLSDAIESVKPGEDVSEYTDKIEDLSERLNGEGGLTKVIEGPHEAIIVPEDENDEEFEALIAAVLAVDPAKVSEIKTAEGLTAYGAVAKPAPKYGLYEIKASANGVTYKDYVIYEKEITDTEHIVTDSDRTEIQKVLNALTAKVVSNTKYYKAVVNGEVPEEGDTVATKYNVNYTYNPRTYTVKVKEGDKVVEEITFTGTETASFKLPAPEETDFRYDYKIKDGNTTVVKSVAGTAGKHDVINMSDLADGKDIISITREKYCISTDKIDEFVNALNDAMKANSSLKDDKGNLKAAFVPVKTYTNGAVNGAYTSIVLRMDYASATVGGDLLRAIAEAMVDIAVSTPYVAFDGAKNEFLYSVENKGTEVNVQALLDLFLTSGLGSDVFTEIIDENGSIIDNVKIPEGSTVVREGLLNSKAALGASLIETDIQLGTSKENSQTVPLTVTLTGNQSKYLKGVRAFFDKFGAYGSVELADGKISMEAVMPEEVYTVYMSVMLMMGEISLEGIDDADLTKAIYKLADLFEDEINSLTWKKAETIVNSTLGTEYDFEPFSDIVERIIGKAKDVVNKDASTSTSQDAETFNMTLSYDVESMLGDKVKDFTKLLKKPATISIPMSFTVKNMTKEVEAIVLDLGKEGVINKLQYVEDVAATLNGAKGVTYVILTQDIEADGANSLVLNINQPTVLNLNGHDILGTVKANAALRIVDSSLDEPGMVFDVEGCGNVRIAAGKYVNVSEAEMATMLHDTYVVNEDGYVTSKYYNVTEDADGNITVEMSTELADITKGNMQTLVADMVSDLFFEFYNTAGVSVDGKKIFSADVEDILTDVVSKDYRSFADKLKNCVDVTNTKNLVNDLYAKFGDLNKIADVVEVGGEVVSYNVTTKDWGVKVGITEDNKLDVSLKADGDKTRQMTLKFADANPELADSLREFAKIFSVSFDYSYNGIEFTDGKVDLKGSAHIKVELDLENEDGTASDYITALGAIIAYNETDAAEREKLVNAISLYERNIYAGYLQECIEKVTIAELIDAVQALAKATEEGLTFADVLREIGLRNLLSDTIRLTGTYNALLELSYNLVDAVEKGIAYTEKASEKLDHPVDIDGQTLAKVKDVTPDGYWCTYGGDFNYSENFTIDVRLKMFAGEYESPVDYVIYLLEQIPDPVSEIYHNCERMECAEDCTIKNVDNRMAWLQLYDVNMTDLLDVRRVDHIALTREKYDELTELYKELIPADLYQRLLDAEALFEALGVWAVVVEDEVIHYTGKQIKPEIRVYHGSTLLKAKKDYTLSYKYNTSAATADSGSKAPRAIVTLKKNYTGKLYVYFTIEKIDLVRASQDAEYCEKVGLVIKDAYTASTESLKKTNVAKPTVYLNGKKISTTQYGYYYPENPTLDKKEEIAYKETGEYPIVIYGKDKNFAAVWGTTADGVVEIDKTQGYTVTQHVADKKLSNASVKLLGADGKKATSFVYTGEPINPTLVVTYKSGNKTYELVEGKHFTVERTNNTNVGTATFILTGTEKTEDAKCTKDDTVKAFSFYGTKKVTFKITTAQDISSTKYAKITMLDAEGNALKKGKYVTKDYTGSAIELTAGVDFKVTAADGVTELKSGEDYTVSYKKNINAGTATITFKGIGNFKGSVSKSFKIAKKALDQATMLVTDNIIVVANESGGTDCTTEIKLQYVNPVTKEVVTLELGKDYTLKCKNTTKIATERDAHGNYVYPAGVKIPNVTVTGKGNFKGSFKMNYTIIPADFMVTAKDVKYTAKDGNYKTTVKVQNSLSGTQLFISSDSRYEVMHNGEYVDILENKEALIAAGRLNKSGKRILFLSEEEETTGIQMRVHGVGKNNYIGKHAYDEYRIYKTSINGSNTKVKITQPFVYNKYTQSINLVDENKDGYPDNITVKYKGKLLKAGTDYIITETSYKNNLFAGTATVKIEGINTYGGTYTKKFMINKFKHDANDITLGNEDGVTLYIKDANGELIPATIENVNTLLAAEKQGKNTKPADSIVLVYIDVETLETYELVYGRDYKLTWKNTTKVKSADSKNAPTVVIKGIGNFKGSITVKYTIY